MCRASDLGVMFHELLVESLATQDRVCRASDLGIMFHELLVEGLATQD